MTSVNAVIGAGFGDEGKGLMTSYLAANDWGATVVRSNGGAQAGHTVTLADGTRNVFSHIGSGALFGHNTYLSEFFVSNPMLWLKEWTSFQERFGKNPVTTVHPKSLVTTPYDMILNMAFEDQRGDDQHGSVGIGFGETIERSETFLPLTVGDLLSLTEKQIRDELRMIKHDYMPSRLWFDLPEKYQQIINDKYLDDSFIRNCKLFLNEHMVQDYSVLKDTNLIFEGAQGLLLDQRHPYFPHVTRSNTGMKNVMSIVDQVGGISPDDITVNYVSRVYTTRHGAGPLSNEMNIPFDVVDETNIHNDWQGGLRFAPLDFDILYDTILDDAQNYPAAIKQEMTFTCFDQIGMLPSYVEDGQVQQVASLTFRDKIRSMSDYISFGPTHQHVRRYSNE